MPPHRWLLCFICCALKQPCYGDCIRNERITPIQRISLANQCQIKITITKVKCNNVQQIVSYDNSWFPILINPFYSCLRKYQENLEQLLQVCCFRKGQSDHGGSQAPDDSGLLNHVGFIHVERVKFLELCWNFNGQLQQLGNKSEVSHIDTGSQKAWLPIVICWENIPTPVCIYICVQHLQTRYLYHTYRWILYITLILLAIDTVICKYIPCLYSPHSFTTSEMRSLCSCNGSKGSCGISQPEGFRPVSCDGEGFRQWSSTNGGWFAAGCGKEQDRSGGDDLTVFELREEHDVAAITVLWRFDLDGVWQIFLLLSNCAKHLQAFAWLTTPGGGWSDPKAFRQPKPGTFRAELLNLLWYRKWQEAEQDWEVWQAFPVWPYQIATNLQHKHNVPL